MQKNKKILVLLAVVVFLVVIIIIAANSNKSTAPTVKRSQPVTGEPVAAPTTPEGDIAVNALPEGTTVVVPGTSPVTPDDVVVTPEGKAVQYDVAPLSSEAPKQTGPIAEQNLSSDVIKLQVSSQGWEPKEFTVKAGDPVTFAVTNLESNFMHIFKFDEPAMMAVVIGVGPSETRAMTFNAPSKAGEYTFRCDVPGHANRGEIGKMIVR